MSSYIDIHSHQICASTSTFTLVNCFPSELEIALQKEPQQFYSVGIHPWHINTDFGKEMDVLSNFANHKQVLAIGETGIDKVCDTPFNLQLELFKKQIAIAEEVKKPLIIHCVKAYSELIQLKKECQPSMPWILHGYRGNKNSTEQLLAHNFYFSLGKEISHLQASLRTIPLNKLFLETDNENVSIEMRYKMAANMLEIPEEKLKDLVYSNFKNLF
ncbi:MAG: TatD family hydrolase [Paludibacteraceae bacterium]|nr:TatD family hydrolase [Paludibacteraceae bacterium]MBN2788312.1 TatD family hydrolase [Paludibacteraceae bacterium]